MAAAVTTTGQQQGTGVGLLTVDRLLGQRAQVSEANQAATGRKGETVGEAGHDSPVPDRRQTPGKRSAQFREAERAGPQGRSRAAQGGKAGAVAEAGPTPTYPIRFRYRAEVRLWFCK